jgi:uncharacterized protein
MRAVRLLESLVRDGHVLIRLLSLQTQLCCNDAALYPVDANCVELGVPVGLSVGFPGPRVPSKYQDPMPIDDMAEFFPEFMIVLQHGGEPWADVCVKLMVKWSNISYTSSAIALRHIPQDIIYYVNARGADRVMFASDYPLSEARTMHAPGGHRHDYAAASDPWLPDLRRAACVLWPGPIGGHPPQADRG